MVFIHLYSGPVTYCPPPPNPQPPCRLQVGQLLTSRASLVAGPQRYACLFAHCGHLSRSHSPHRATMSAMAAGLRAMCTHTKFVNLPIQVRVPEGVRLYLGPL